MNRILPGMTKLSPVITIDGPSGSGKGTISLMLAKHLGWHYLDSGALYRILGYAALQQKLSEQDEEQLIALIPQLDINFDIDHDMMEKKVILAGKNITNEIRAVKISQMSSKISAIAAVRQALVERQREFCKPPGLVTDGRDMGTVIFPDAELKVYLTASAAERAQRRLEQLKNRGFDGNLAAIQRELELRDKRDTERAVAPLKPAIDAHIIDSTDKPINAVFEEILSITKTQQLN